MLASHSKFFIIYVSLKVVNEEELIDFEFISVCVISKYLNRISKERENMKKRFNEIKL